MPFLKTTDYNKKYDGFKENREKIVAQCSKEAKQKDCKDYLKNVPKSQLKRKEYGDPNSPYTDTFVRAGSVIPFHLKEKFLKFVKPKEEKKKDVFRMCTKDAPCNLECLYGRKLTETEENPEENIVKGLVYTKGGAVYETTAYRLADDFGWEAQPNEEPKEETAYFDKKRKKKKKPEIMEFTGPVKIVIVDSDGWFTSYQAKRCLAACIQLGHIVIGCTVMCLVFYTLKFNHHYSTNAHIFCCVLAFQYCFPAAMLYSNKVSVSGSVMSTKHQFRDALLMRTFAVIIVFIGLGILHSWRMHINHGNIFNAHSLPGYKACALILAEYVANYLTITLIGHDRGHIIDCYLHILSILALIYSLESFYYGLTLHYTLKHYFKYKHWHLWVFAFSVFFNFVATFRHSMDCLHHLWLGICFHAKRLYKCLRPRASCTPRDVVA